ncbi:hypothetical protein AOCH_001001 [Aspergillus ochraceoroseus]|uniref:Erythromycin esterase n=1 Tax=Aspergillus ochraceoroseus TaxID=138278 RepID=A0A0F8VIU0_9EURO|nr:hypothetical protein AOCH_001001 [Aspergillus ochraceoroseus]
MPVRRSARLRSLQQATQDSPTGPVTDNNNDNINMAKRHKNLTTVIERDEIPSVDVPTPRQPTPKAAVTQTPRSTHSQKKSPTKTPTSVMTRPTHQEMHPSKVHQSTTKKPDSGLILGFNPVKKDAQGNVVKDTPAQHTPSKVNASPASNYYGTPAFEFKFSCADSQLSDEAKHLMESVREDVARIKAQMIHEKHSDAPSEASQITDRRIAKPKGKAGRFSDAHMAEFKKMDSIAGHASAFRATPGRFQPLVKIEKTLKRKNSKAHLDEAESHSSSAKAAPKASPGPATPGAKRVKRDKADDISTGRLITPKRAISRPRAGVRSSLMTPTRSSMARASSSNLPTLGSLKSILRRHQPLFSRDPSKIAAGTHFAAPDFTSDLLLKPSRENSQEPAPTPSPKKRVEFTPAAQSPRPQQLVSPSPSKIPMVVAYPGTSNIVYPTLPSLTPDRTQVEQLTTVRSVRPSELPLEATLPEIPGMPHGISHKKRHRAADDEADGENVPPVGKPSDERSAKRLKFNSPAPVKLPPSSPLKARSHTPSRLISRPGRVGTPVSARAKSRGVLSVSRLNLLSQPKHRS